MNLLFRRINWLRSLTLSLLKRSLKAHASFFVSDVEISLAFYRKLDFRQVTATRAGEVVLIRNHRCDELNLVARTAINANEQLPARAVLLVGDLTRELAELELAQIEPRAYPTAIQAEVADPDGNIIALQETRARHPRPGPNIYHIATRAELLAGLSEHYYLPSDSNNRFVLASPGAALISIACKRIAQEANAPPWIITMDARQLSIEDQLTIEADFGSQGWAGAPTYKHVNSPIARTAIVAVGECSNDDRAFPWPEEFHPLDAFLS